MGKTFNFYCDESTHIENDGNPYMILSYISTPYHLLRAYNKDIRAMKIKHHYIGELKWSKLSASQYPFYSELIDYFFSSELHFRAIVINKSHLNHAAFNQSHADFYDKMYYQLLNKKIHPHYHYNIYLDIKDSFSYQKADNLKSYLCRDYQSVRNLQIIRSYESELMQLTDVLMGAVNYKIRGLDKVTAKNDIIAKIEEHTQHDLLLSTSRDKDKFNLFFIDLSHGF